MTPFEIRLPVFGAATPLYRAWSWYAAGVQFRKKITYEVSVTIEVQTSATHREWVRIGETHVVSTLLKVNPVPDQPFAVLKTQIEGEFQ